MRGGHIVLLPAWLMLLLLHPETEMTRYLVVHVPAEDKKRKRSDLPIEARSYQVHSQQPKG